MLNLKFDLEIHLLCDFNETIQRFSEIEKTYQSFRTNNLPQNIDKPTKKQENEENTYKACQVASSTSSESIWLNLTQSSDSTSRSQLQLEETCSAIDNSLYKGVGGAHLKMVSRNFFMSTSFIVLKFSSSVLLKRRTIVSNIGRNF